MPRPRGAGHPTSIGEELLSVASRLWYTNSYERFLSPTQPGPPIAEEAKKSWFRPSWPGRA